MCTYFSTYDVKVSEVCGPFNNAPTYAWYTVYSFLTIVGAEGCFVADFSKLLPLTYLIVRLLIITFENINFGDDSYLPTGAGLPLKIFLHATPLEPHSQSI